MILGEGYEWLGYTRDISGLRDEKAAAAMLKIMVVNMLKKKTTFVFLSSPDPS